MKVNYSKINIDDFKIIKLIIPRLQVEKWILQVKTSNFKNK